MPIYEYICTNCKTQFELKRPLADFDKPAYCPKCNSNAQKMISSFGAKTGSYLQASEKPFRKE